jgi:hypothetical protein
MLACAQEFFFQDETTDTLHQQQQQQQIAFGQSEINQKEKKVKNRRDSGPNNETIINGSREKEEVSKRNRLNTDITQLINKKKHCILGLASRCRSSFR